MASKTKIEDNSISLSVMDLFVNQQSFSLSLFLSLTLSLTVSLKHVNGTIKFEHRLFAHCKTIKKFLSKSKQVEKPCSFLFDIFVSNNGEVMTNNDEHFMGANVDIWGSLTRLAKPIINIPL